MLEDFIALSEELTGVRPLDQNQQRAAAYLKRCQEHKVVGPVLEELLKLFKSIPPQGDSRAKGIKEKIMADAHLMSAAQQIIYLWYVSAFFESDPRDVTKGTWVYGDGQQYAEGLMWSAIGVHAPMTRGGDFGFWERTLE